jgi:hypothetical protein
MPVAALDDDALAAVYERAARGAVQERAGRRLTAHERREPRTDAAEQRVRAEHARLR